MTAQSPSRPLSVPPSLRRSIVFLLLIVCSPASAQLRDSFDSPQPTWSLKEADCGVSVLAHRRDYREVRSGQASEHLRLAVGNGTYIYLVQPIGRAPLIEEFRPTLFVKADRPSVQLMARVVLPRSIDRGSGRPITSFLRGDLYTDVGRWQQLGINGAGKLLENEVRALRTQFPAIDPREAYVDLIVLNAYSAPGPIELWLDDLEIEGYVNLDNAVGPQILRRPAGGDVASGVREHQRGSASGVREHPDSSGVRSGQDYREADASRSPMSADASRSPITTDASRPPTITDPSRVPSLATVQGSLLLVRSRPMMVRAIQHRGEPLEWLKGLGFNTIKLASSPSAADLNAARRLELWLIAPPPYGDAAPPAEALDPVIAWSLGSRLAERDLSATSDLAAETRALDPAQRPLLAGADSALAEYSRLVSLLLLDRPTLGATSELADSRRWLIGRPRLARPGTPAVAALATQRSPRLAEQLVLLAGGAAFEEDVDPEQLRLAALHAVAAGARGLVFTSDSPGGGLAIDSGPAALRTDAIRLVNMELRMLEPWIAAGQLSEELAAEGGGVQVSVLTTDRSRLLVVTQHAAAQQYVLGPPPYSSLSVVVAGVGISDKAYLVSLAGIKPLPIAHTSSGARITLEDAPHAAAIVITQDPLAIHHLNRTLDLPEACRLRYDVTARRLARTAAIDQELVQLGRPLAPAADWLKKAQEHLDQARRLFESKDWVNSHAATTKAERLLAQVRRGHWEATAAAFPSPAASPCVAQFTTLPLHWAVARRIGGGRWGPNIQPGGDMESLDQMLHAGWQQQRQPGEGVGVDVSLSLAGPHSGRSAVRMQAWPLVPGKSPQVIERPPVVITSSPVGVRQGQMVRIHGWANVPRPVAGTSDGLVVFDSIGGPELGDRIRLTQGWREFTLYRAVPQTGELTVTFALTGLGEAWLDDLSVALLDPEPIRPQ